MQASAQQVTGFARDAKGNIIYATSNPGKVFRLSPQRAVEGTYTSLVRDAQTVADWGTLSWRASVPAGSRVDSYAIRQHGNAGRDMEPMERAIRGVQWRGDQESKRAVPAVEGRAERQSRHAGAHVGIGGVRAAQSAAEGDEPDGASRGHVFQKPYPTGDPDIAGFDDQAPDRRILSATPNPGGASSTLGRRAYQRGTADVRVARRRCQRRRAAVRDSRIAARGTPAGNR